MTDKQKERIKNWKLHDSQRGHFSLALYKEMAKNEDIWLICADLGWGVFDAHRKDFPDRALSIGAAEFSAVGIACGLALEGKIPFVYSITPFLLYRPFELLRTYVNHEKIPVRLVGSGRDDDYKLDGYSHDATDAGTILSTLPNIEQHYPDLKTEAAHLVKSMVKNNRPQFISLKR